MEESQVYRRTDLTQNLLGLTVTGHLTSNFSCTCTRKWHLMSFPQYWSELSVELEFIFFLFCDQTSRFMKNLVWRNSTVASYQLAHDDTASYPDNIEGNAILASALINQKANGTDSVGQLVFCSNNQKYQTKTTCEFAAMLRERRFSISSGLFNLF